MILFKEYLKEYLGVENDGVVEVDVYRFQYHHLDKDKDLPIRRPLDLEEVKFLDNFNCTLSHIPDSIDLKETLVKYPQIKVRGKWFFSDKKPQHGFKPIVFTGFVCKEITQGIKEVFEEFKKVNESLSVRSRIRIEDSFCEATWFNPT